MVVGNNNINTSRNKLLHFLGRCNPVINGNDEIGSSVRKHPLKCLDGKAIPFAKTMRNIWPDIGAKVAKRQRQKTGRAHSVNIKITKYRNTLMRFNGFLYSIGSFIEAGYDTRIKPIPLKRRIEKLLSFRHGSTPTRHKNPCHQRIDGKFLRELLLKLGNLRQNIPVRA